MINHNSVEVVPEEKKMKLTTKLASRETPTLERLTRVAWIENQLVPVDLQPLVDLVNHDSKTQKTTPVSAASVAMQELAAEVGVVIAVGVVVASEEVTVMVVASEEETVTGTVLPEETEVVAASEEAAAVVVKAEAPLEASEQMQQENEFSLSFFYLV